MSENKRFCILPWVHMQLSPSGKVHSCCQSNFKSPLGDLNLQSFDEIWNGQALADLRQKMLKGEHVPECSRCYELEDLGVQTLRQTSNERWKKDLLRVQSGQTEAASQPLYLDLRFDNKCNHKCRSCTPAYSHSWQADYEKLRPNNKASFTVNSRLEQSWNEIEKWLPTIEEIYFAGGEPLMSPYHKKTLEHLIKSGNQSAVLIYNTNFSVLTDEILDLWSQFPTMWVGASLDGIKEIGEFIRHGQDWSRIEKNRLRLKEKCPHVRFQIDWTLSIYNIFHLPEALEYFFEREFIQSADDFKLNFLSEPEYLSARLLPAEERAKLNILYKKYEDRFPSELNKILQSVWAFVSKANYEHHRMTFKVFNNKLDKIRAEKSKLLFPELQNLF